ncbi:hypothetical protein DsansV1_C09g0091071 [Dioscorea sansibarensis]
MPKMLQLLQIPTQQEQVGLQSCSTHFGHISQCSQRRNQNHLPQPLQQL